MHEELEQETYLDLLVQAYEQQEANQEALEDSRFGETYLGRGKHYVTKYSKEHKQRKFKKERYED